MNTQQILQKLDELRSQFREEADEAENKEASVSFDLCALDVGDLIAEIEDSLKSCEHDFHYGLIGGVIRCNKCGYQIEDSIA